MKASEFNVEDIATVVTNPVSISVDALKNSGTVTATYGAKQGDVIVFLEEYDENTVIGRPIQGAANSEILVAVVRNGNPDWYSLADVRRADHEMSPIDAFRKEMRELPNDFVRLETLKGKTIYAGNAIAYKVVKSFHANPDTGRMAPDTDEEGNILLRERTAYELHWKE